MCNYEESCEKPLLERKGNRDIFIAILPSTLRSDRSHSSERVVVSATRSINTPKSLWQMKEL